MKIYFAWSKTNRNWINGEFNYRFSVKNSFIRFIYKLFDVKTKTSFVEELTMSSSIIDMMIMINYRKAIKIRLLLMHMHNSNQIKLERNLNKCENWSKMIKHFHIISMSHWIRFSASRHHYITKYYNLRNNNKQFQPLGTPIDFDPTDSSKCLNYYVLIKKNSEMWHLVHFSIALCFEQLISLSISNCFEVVSTGAKYPMLDYFHHVIIFNTNRKSWTN